MTDGSGSHPLSIGDVSERKQHANYASAWAKVHALKNGSPEDAAVRAGLDAKAAEFREGGDLYKVTGE